MFSPQTTSLPGRTERVACTSPDASACNVFADLARQLIEARARSRRLIDALDEAALLGPQQPIVNPPLWELGHLGWFTERWTLRPRADGSMGPSLRADADALYDSARVAHATRWNLPLPSLDATWRYVDGVLGQLLARLADEARTCTEAPSALSAEIAPAAGAPGALAYYAQLSVLHEQMHAEAFSYSRQTLGYPALGLPDGAGATAAQDHSPAHAGVLGGGDVEIQGGLLQLGARRGSGFVFDNEKWAHPVPVAPFAIARYATSVGEFAAFVDDGGYADARWWDPDGWIWRERAQATRPMYWRRLQTRQGWEMRIDDSWTTLPSNVPMCHVNAFEAAAWCRWAQRRLPSESEWEAAASTAPAIEAAASGALGGKRHFPWGDGAPEATRANLWRTDPPARTHPIAVDALPDGDSGWGCRQMIGNVWEWTASVFDAYPDFVVDPYREYSQPWFGTHRVLRGGSFATAATLIRNSWRNFYTPERQDVYVGFRSCARSPE